MADGTFKVVPTIFFQLYTIHFDSLGSLNPPTVYCLLPDKSRATYDRMIQAVKLLITAANPQTTILLDFEIGAMNAF